MAGRHRRRPSRVFAMVLMVAIGSVLIATCAPAQPGPIFLSPARLTHGSTPLTLVALGDSVPAASGCPCTSFVTLLGARFVQDTGMPVEVYNLGQPGQTSAGLQAELDSGPTATAVMQADIVTITIGANDFGYALAANGQCGGQDGMLCYRPEFASLRTNLQAIIERIKVLRSGRPTAIRLTNYWDIWKDGQVGRQFGAQYTQLGDTLTHQVNEAIAEVAANEDVTFVDLLTPFKGVSGTDDDTALLAPDGDHPSQDGHQVIADTLAEAGLAPLVLMSGS